MAMQITSDRSELGQLCTQVITRAHNPATGEIRVFPTPCDVPDGWIQGEPQEISEEVNDTSMDPWYDALLWGGLAIGAIGYGIYQLTQ